MENYYEKLHADYVPHIQPTKLHDIDKFFELQKDIERQEMEQEISQDGLGDDDWCPDYENIRGGEDE